MEKTASRVLIIGFDGLDYERFKEAAGDGFVVLPLFSPIPVTGPAWTSLYTGDGVSRHGVKEGWGREWIPYRFGNPFLDELAWLVRVALGKVGLKSPAQKPLLYHCRRHSKSYRSSPSRYLWDTLGKSGFAVKLVNLPITYPPRRVNGVHVAGFPLPKRGAYAFPAELNKLLPKDYFELSDIIHWFQNPLKSRMGLWRPRLKAMGFDAALRKTREHASVLVDLFKQLPSANLEMIQFSFVDRMGHVFGIQGHTGQAIYELVVELIAKLQDGANYDQTIVVSDHGFQGFEHTEYGVFAFQIAGAVITRVKDDRLPMVDIRDVAPTVATLLGVTHDCEGRPVQAGESSQSALAATREEEEFREELERQLRELGYL